MDRFDAMRVFTRVVERRSFTLAAEDLGLPRSTVTDAIKQLEARLGVRLLERTTRQVRPTLDGEAYHQRCLSLIADVEEAEAAFGGAKPKGLLRVDVHGTLVRHFVMPRLPDFLAPDRWSWTLVTLLERQFIRQLFFQSFGCLPLTNTSINC